MAEVSISVTATGSPAAAGAYCDGTAWGAVSFNHAALVSAGRSRADGFDFWLRHTGTGLVPIVAVTGANTAACRVLFNLAAAVNAGATDSAYRLVFGDLGWHASRAVGAAGTSAPSLSAVSASVPDLTLPPPARPVEMAKIYDVDELLASENRVGRRRVRNQNPRRVASIEWRYPSAEDAYEVRAWHDAQRGGAGSAAVPAWLTDLGFDPAITRCQAAPNSLVLRQDSRRKYTVRLVVRELVA